MLYPVVMKAITFTYKSIKDFQKVKARKLTN